MLYYWFIIQQVFTCMKERGREVERERSRERERERERERVCVCVKEKERKRASPILATFKYHLINDTITRALTTGYHDALGAIGKAPRNTVDSEMLRDWRVRKENDHFPRLFFSGLSFLVTLVLFLKFFSLNLCSFFYSFSFLLFISLLSSRR